MPKPLPPESVPHSKHQPTEKVGNQPKRRVGILKGKLIVPDNFDDPLPEDVLQDFEATDSSEPT
ncbi:MAG TPA: hypothetical protein VGM81_07660 [Burkholderiaceae bacterium]|jgi:hypothetical protein